MSYFTRLHQFAGALDTPVERVRLDVVAPHHYDMQAETTPKKAAAVLKESGVDKKTAELFEDLIAHAVDPVTIRIVTRKNYDDPRLAYFCDK